MPEKPIYVTRPSLPDFNEYAAEIRSIWETGQLTNAGEKHNKLAAALGDILGAENVTLLANGHLALECAIQALCLTGEVITTPFTFASTTQAIVRCGLTPVFCDIEPETYTLDVLRIEPLITERTTAILPVHVYGSLCDVREIDEVARKHGLKVVYDAAHAFGVSLDGTQSGAFGDISMFSFHATKNFNTVEGGALTYGDASLEPKLNSLRNFGLDASGDAPYIGGNAKMSEFHAAMGLCNLRHFYDETQKRKAASERYAERLSGAVGIKILKPQSNVTPNYCYFPVVFDGFVKSRDEVCAELEKHNIYARKYFYPLTSTFAAYKSRFEVQATPVAEYIAERVLTLPLYAGLSVEEADLICDIILS